ncbi:hypothetical protein SDC9_111001 [bioreactor metagenome]|uniref:Uncharacterized protein n=1 Tax=bioreactor metagenome TaxID=1076179 RepID=A0A645BF81_9ZZZZ
MLHIPPSLCRNSGGGKLEVFSGDAADVFFREFQVVVGRPVVEAADLFAVGLFAHIIIIQRGGTLRVQVAKHVFLHIVKRTHKLVEADIAGVDLIDCADKIVDAQVHINIDERDHEHCKREHEHQFGAQRQIDKLPVHAGEQLHCASSVSACAAR